MANGNCPASGCTKTPRPGQLLCLDHWRLVPGDKQRAVNRTWRQYQRDRDMTALDAYRTARDEAIAAADKEAKQGGLF